MEKKKFDPKQLIGYVLIAVLATWMLYNNKPTEEELKEQEAQKTEEVVKERSVEKANEKVVTQEYFSAITKKDSSSMAKVYNKLGAFAFGASLPSATDTVTEISNDVLAFEFSNKGGYLNSVELKDFKTHDQQPLYLV